MQLSEIIKNYRKENKLSLRAFADKTDFSFQYISNIENGSVKNPSIPVVQSLARAMNMTFDELLRMTDDFTISSDIAETNDDKTKESIPSTFSTAEEAIEFILRVPLVANFGGYDLDKMTDDEVIEFATDVAEMIKMLGKKHK